MSAAFTARQRLRFADCDPAGIAYYPRYFEMCDGVIEDWTEEVVGVPRRKLHLDLGYALPTVDLRADFSAVSRLGDWLDFELRVEELGRSSVGLAIEVSSAGERRFGVRFKQVLIDSAKTRPIPWPDDWRARIQEAMA